MNNDYLDFDTDSNMIKFLRAVAENIPKNEKSNYGTRTEFVCPVCGGVAWCGRSEGNGHVRAVCKRCGFSVIE